MKIYLFYHSVISDWNHGNAHFLRGIVTAFLRDGHDVKIFEPANGWSLQNLINMKGTSVIESFREYFPGHLPELYHVDHLNPAEILHDADLVLVHEWNDPKLVKSIGDYRAEHAHFILFFHDTHHRAVTSPDEMRRYDLRHYDGVLAFGEVLRKIYLKKGWARRVWTWHEAADTTIFHPINKAPEKEGDLVWIGNWGDEERTTELKEFIINPVRKLGLKAAFYGVRYPAHAIRLLRRAGIGYKGWIPNYLVPQVFSRYRITVHVPRKPYVTKLPGIPTIRPFEAMASGIPLLCSPWQDSEQLFTEGEDYLRASDGKDMTEQLDRVLNDEKLSASLSSAGLATVKERHTCFHRAEELFRILEELREEPEVARRNLKNNR
jgi:spore maturation protein CgeB